MITLIAAIADNNAIGANNSLLWHLPNDFKRFKELTTGHHIIMGRKTFESFPKPLPNRIHVVISRQNNFSPEGCIVVPNLEAALSTCPKNEPVFVIGGGEIYNQFIDKAEYLDITRVHHRFEGDTFFPKIDRSLWELTSESHNFKDDKHLYDYSFQIYVRKK